MSSHVYRCSKCRTRNTFRRPVTDYIIQRRCRECLHNHFYVDKERVARRPCRCEGYHYAHRPGSPCCVHNAWHPVHRSRDPEVELQMVVEGKGKPYLGGPIPF